MAKSESNTMWGGRFASGQDTLMESINASIGFDQRLSTQDIQGSVSHASMLGETGIITKSDAEMIIAGLKKIQLEIETGEFLTKNQIKELEKETTVHIGNHSHAHEYLVDLENDAFMKDIQTANETFIKKIGYNPIFFSYPFGEYSNFIKDHIVNNFSFSFGQHSGVIDVNKDRYELPRFPINEKYGDLKRFEFLINLHPLQYKTLYPNNKFLTKNNPPKFSVEFFNDQKNLNNINCFSDEGNQWKKSVTNIEKKTLTLSFREKFLFRRGRINCSLNDNGIWRWFGVQFSIEQN